MSEIRTAKDLYVVIIGKTKTIAQHVEENKWRICGSMVNYQNTDVEVIKALNLANDTSTTTEQALNIDSVINFICSDKLNDVKNANCKEQCSFCKTAYKGC